VLGRVPTAGLALSVLLRSNPAAGIAPAMAGLERASGNAVGASRALGFNACD
jgi:hypothetical protein